MKTETEKAYNKGVQDERERCLKIVETKRRHSLPQQRISSIWVRIKFGEEKLQKWRNKK